jgi:hypothetical protein
MSSSSLQTAKDPAEGCIVLTDTLLRCVNNYLILNPSMTWRQVLTALENVADAVEEQTTDGKEK